MGTSSLTEGCARSCSLPITGALHILFPVGMVYVEPITPVMILLGSGSTLGHGTERDSVLDLSLPMGMLQDGLYCPFLL